MSRELVLVPKRKYDDLIQRATAEKTVDDSNIPFVKRRRVEGNGDDTTSDDTSTIVNKTNKNTMNETIVGENQYGADSIQKRPDGGKTLESEIRNLKRSLNIVEGFERHLCNKVIQHRANFKRHLNSHETTYKCFLCNRKFSRLDSLQRHERGHLVGYVRPNDTYNCQHCGMGFKDYTTLFNHSKTTHPVQIGGNVNISNHPTVTKSAFEDSIHILTIYPSDEDKYDLLTFFFNIRQKIKDALAERCDKVKHVK
ncbi:Hypothetical predicted protein [Mytilus galloprovincialis]|uniref:C2H2-type domain-containing protein n=1 Tax=Mytilus galloprovincialis TaxID=29158 RepID=A0A8B6FA16_MYTGA|nr:Hypothetical predicted protein [Mytilus galloprovincialis]